MVPLLVLLVLLPASVALLPASEARPVVFKRASVAACLLARGVVLLDFPVLAVLLVAEVFKVPLAVSKVVLQPPKVVLTVAMAIRGTATDMAGGATAMELMGLMPTAIPMVQMMTAAITCPATRDMVTGAFWFATETE